MGKWGRNQSGRGKDNGKAWLDINKAGTDQMYLNSFKTTNFQNKWTLCQKR